MKYVVDRFDSGSSSIWLKDDYTGNDHKVIKLTSNDWAGYGREIQVIATDKVAVVTLKNGMIKQFDLTKSNVAVEIV